MEYMNKEDTNNYDRLISSLLILADLLNKHNIDWCLGASMMLKLRGIDVTVEDIDVIIKTDDISLVEEVLKFYSPQKKVPSSIYLTDHFYELLIDNIDIDIMIGFKVKTNKGVYSFNETSKVDKIVIKGTTIYLASLEEWLKAYTAMNRVKKVKVIQNHLKNRR